MNQEPFDKGMAVRRAVVGEAYVEKSMKSADDFNMPMQELVTQFCWGEVWTRPGLDRRSRSLLICQALLCSKGYFAESTWGMQDTRCIVNYSAIEARCIIK